MNAGTSGVAAVPPINGQVAQRSPMHAISSDNLVPICYLRTRRQVAIGRVRLLQHHSLGIGAAHVDAMGQVDRLPVATGVDDDRGGIRVDGRLHTVESIPIPFQVISVGDRQRAGFAQVL